MTQSKHTPGPWEVHSNNSGWSGNQALGSRETTYIINRHKRGVHLSDEMHPNEEQQANAALIAAAPDLLEALKNLRAEVTEYFCGTRPKFLDPAMSKAFCAIAKAEGK